MKKYNRILVKISGEAFSGENGFGIDEQATAKVAAQLCDIADSGVELAVVVGGGNFWRGRTSENMNKVTADQIGMMATLMNALALVDAIAQIHSVILCSSLAVDKVVDCCNVFDAIGAMEEGAIAVFACGTGAPFFSTDTAVVLRACEIGADAVLCAKAIDGIYDSDPKTNPAAKKYDEISYDKVIADNLKALDLTAVAMARENKMPIICFGKDEPNGILRILNGEKLGTIVH